MKCRHMNDKKRCEAEAIKNSEFCYWHDPNKAEDRKKASSIGGKASYYNQGLVIAEPIDITSDNRAIIFLLVDTINRVRRIQEDGSMDIRIANCIGFLSSKIIEAQREIITVEKLDAIEEKLKETGVYK